MRIYFVLILCLITLAASAQMNNPEGAFIMDNYTKTDTTIMMRDGIKLYTVIYSPKDQSLQYPFLMQRTPYSVAPYGAGNFTKRLGPTQLVHEKYIFVFQDVRGRYMSEGHNLEVTPQIDHKKTKMDVDESSDTYDAVDWLIKNIPNNNGKVGVYGISYPGFYASTTLLANHPAIKAVSPQAPEADEFIGDDANHNGAFFLLDNFDFMNYFGKERTGPVQNYGGPMFEMNEKDAYQFFLNLGPIKNTQSKQYYNHRSYIWDEYLAHDTYDQYWQSRNLRPHLKNITTPTLVVGGWFDAEDMFGALHTFEAIKKQSPVNHNHLVMGPWTHGAWASPKWTQFGTYEFGSNTSKYFQDSLQAKFFNYYLKDKGDFNVSEATLFNTGTNQWKSFANWPPMNATPVDYYLSARGKLSVAYSSGSGFDEYISDPKKPVPYTNGVYGGRNNEYLAEDQRFAEMRPDVVSYVSDVLENDVTLAGRINADLYVSTTGTDADFIVKVIDVLPDTTSTPGTMPRGISMAGYERMVRCEVMRGKFRNSFEHPEPFIPNKVSEVKFELNEVLHTFKKGHKIMVQVQSSWFPLVDMNPQKFIRIPDADESDFQKAIIRIYHDGMNSSKVILPILSDNN